MPIRGSPLTRSLAQVAAAWLAPPIARRAVDRQRVRRRRRSAGRSRMVWFPRERDDGALPGGRRRRGQSRPVRAWPRSGFMPKLSAHARASTIQQIDIVSTATPDHWHALCSTSAIH